ncbi:hypothetical protein [Demequina sp. NBRC 110051]|uniref:hypothetical protein n=1 Tax=Demequina sp. NBRC 110051 TaxID=1570340 RepID=UPI000A0415CA|nr:hypothetical protein [Demequina sp. NBRC 110051]
MTRSIEERLSGALIHLDKAIEYGARPALDEVTIDAISLRISASIECLRQLPEERRMAMFGDSWHDMWGMRNRIADHLAKP